MLKNFAISTHGIDIPTTNLLAKKIAHNNYHKLWIDSNGFTKRDVMTGLIELDCFPLIMPVSGDIHMEADVKDFWEWLNVFRFTSTNR